uniref:Uncharacterized protein n=1 Tax=Anguilla anguilla TaxID=7936 RepID=A0A0E9VB94_ANGAN
MHVCCKARCWTVWSHVGSTNKSAVLHIYSLNYLSKLADILFKENHVVPV